MCVLYVLTVHSFFFLFLYYVYLVGEYIHIYISENDYMNRRSFFNGEMYRALTTSTKSSMDDLRRKLRSPIEIRHFDRVKYRLFHIVF